MSESGLKFNQLTRSGTGHGFQINFSLIHVRMTSANPDPEYGKSIVGVILKYYKVVALHNPEV